MNLKTVKDANVRIQAISRLGLYFTILYVPGIITRNAVMTILYVPGITTKNAVMTKVELLYHL